MSQIRRELTQLSISNHKSNGHSGERDSIPPNDPIPLEANTLDAVTALQGEYWHGQMKILIVDGTRTQNNHLDPLLKLLDVVGYHYEVLSSSAEALAMVKREVPDLILLEVLLPDLDGFALCQELRQDPNLQDTTIVFISEITDPESKLLGFTAGAVDYITKPFHPVEVWVRVENHMVRQWLQKELRRKNQNLEREIQERQRIQTSLQDANQRLERLSHMDSLTCAANRRAFDEYYQREWQRAVRDQHPLSLLLCDVDFFKRFNDHYGHVVGDSCLQMVAVALQDSIKRPADFFARYGGEEFVIILPNTTLNGAMVVARHVQENLQRQGIPHEYSDVSDLVTLSIGVATCIPQVDSNMMSLVVFTDQCLYHAKHTGRNRIHAQEFVPAVSAGGRNTIKDEPYPEQW